MLSNKRLNQIVTELLIRGIKLKISAAFITQSYFAVPKDVRLNCIHFFIIKILSKQELQQIAFHLLDIDSKAFMNLYNKSTATPHFLSDCYYSCIR